MRVHHIYQYVEALLPQVDLLGVGPGQGCRARARVWGQGEGVRPGPLPLPLARAPDAAPAATRTSPCSSA